jgi:hypothetical protein
MEYGVPILKRTNRTEPLQIDPNHYKSIRTTTNRTEPLKIEPNHYKSIRKTTNRTEPLQMRLKEFRSGCGQTGQKFLQMGYA